MAHTASKAYGECTCGSEDPECFNIKISEMNEEDIIACIGLENTAETDCAIDPEEQNCMPFARSTDVRLAFECRFKNREQFTKGTHFLDLDNFYGSTTEGQKLFRSYNNGELKHDVSINR